MAKKKSDTTSITTALSEFQATFDRWKHIRNSGDQAASDQLAQLQKHIKRLSTPIFAFAIKKGLEPEPLQWLMRTWAYPVSSRLHEVQSLLDKLAARAATPASNQVDSPKVSTANSNAFVAGYIAGIQVNGKGRHLWEDLHRLAQQKFGTDHIQDDQDAFETTVRRWWKLMGLTSPKERRKHQK